MGNAITQGTHVITELSARYNYGSETSVDCWQNIRMAIRGARWSESINYICAVKWDNMVSDRQAALFVLNRFLGDSYTDKSWYKLTPDNKLEKYRISGYGQADTAAWEL